VCECASCRGETTIFAYVRKAAIVLSMPNCGRKCGGADRTRFVVGGSCRNFVYVRKVPFLAYVTQSTRSRDGRRDTSGTHPPSSSQTIRTGRSVGRLSGNVYLSLSARSRRSPSAPACASGPCPAPGRLPQTADRRSVHVYAYDRVNWGSCLRHPTHPRAQPVRQRPTRVPSTCDTPNTPVRPTKRSRAHGKAVN
jgi:hypothetical protein